MKKGFQLLGLLCSCLVLWGCPLNTEVPISQQAVPVDSRIIGKYVTIPTADDYEYIISKASATEYKIEKKSVKTEDVTVYKAFLSEVNNVKFLNLYENGSTTPTYYIFKLNINADKTVDLVGLTDNIREKFKTSDELKAFIAKNMDLSFFYDKDESHYKKK